MFLLKADKNKLILFRREPLASGSVNVNTIKFELSSDWNGLTRIAVFRNETETRSILLSDTNQCGFPREVLSSAGQRVYAGVYGTNGQKIVLPTIWASLGVVLEGTAPGGELYPPTPELWEQELAKKGDTLGYTAEGGLGLFAGNKLLSSLPVEVGGGGGTSDHRELTNRDAADQHPINAITGLRDRLEHTITTNNMLSVTEILKIMEEL